MNRGIAILGAGNMGTALAHALACQGQQITIWDHSTEIIRGIREERRNERYLPEICLHPCILPHDEASMCVENARLLILSVPSIFIESVLTRALPYLSHDTIILNVAKGFAPDGCSILPDWIESISRKHPCAHLAGPALANEFARESPTFISISAHNSMIAEETAWMMRGEIFHTETTTDIVGSSLAGILKNSYAIYLGLLGQTCGKDHNLTAVAITKCAQEMECILTSMGAQSKTIRGIAGIGDLMATGSSPLSHNRQLGQALSLGQTLEQILTTNEILPEGVRATPVFLEISRNYHLQTPILNTIAGILCDNYKPNKKLILDALT